MTKEKSGTDNLLEGLMHLKKTGVKVLDYGSRKEKLTLEYIGRQCNVSKQYVERRMKSRPRKKRKRGPKPALSSRQKTTIATSLMRTKKKHGTVSASDAYLRCSKSARSRNTGKPVGKRVVTKIMKTKCYDNARNQKDTWKYGRTSSKKAISKTKQETRKRWCEMMVAMNKDEAWLKKNVIYFDPQRWIIPGTNEKYENQKRHAAAKGKAWFSSTSRYDSINLPGGYPKQKSWSDKNACWYVFVTRGKVFTVIVPPGKVKGKNYGMDYAFAEFEKSMDKEFPDQSKPRVLVSDRGLPMYNTVGWATHDYRSVVSKYGYRLSHPKMNDFQNTQTLKQQWDQTCQPGSIGDLLPHENIMSSMDRLCSPIGTYGASGPGESITSFRNRLRKAAKHITDNEDVLSTCGSFFNRLQDCIRRGGDRISK